MTFTLTSQRPQRHIELHVLLEKNSRETKAHQPVYASKPIQRMCSRSKMIYSWRGEQTGVIRRRETMYLRYPAA